MTHDHKLQRAALYVRVSKSNGTQNLDNQLLKLRELAHARGLEAVVFEDQRSAVKQRPGFEAMMNAARRGEIPGGVLVAALDRMGRSMLGVVQTVLELDRLKVPVISLREPWLDMGGPARSLLISIFGWVAEEERRILVARTHDGLDRARAQGKQLGRRAVELPVAEIQQQRQLGVPWTKLAARFGVSEMTLRRRLVPRHRGFDRLIRRWPKDGQHRRIDGQFDAPRDARSTANESGVGERHDHLMN